jgi:hypothetical protein
VLIDILGSCRNRRHTRAYGPDKRSRGTTTEMGFYFGYKGGHSVQAAPIRYLFAYDLTLMSLPFACQWYSAWLIW